MYVTCTIDFQRLIERSYCIRELLCAKKIIGDVISVTGAFISTFLKLIDM